MPTNRIIIWLILLTVIIYDAMCYWRGWPTISQGVRDLDTSTGGLVRWVWLALWLHFFIGQGWN